ncbi:MAG TPA: divergent polysaccharide deacetylase family protein [Rhizomicrobium sp.]|nr:divergent polysaccharide deacetylase family protein [Rhizomicrobium sp.]
MAGDAHIWKKAAGAAIGVVGALAAVGLGYSLSRAWNAQTPPSRIEIALPTVKRAPPPAQMAVKAPAPPPVKTAPAATPPAAAPKPMVGPSEVAASVPPPPQPVSRASGKPMVAIVVDDLGADIPGTRRAIALPKEVTLAFLPYPERTPELSHDAFCAGHEVILHMPMEPKGNLDPGPNALKVELPKEEVQRRLLWALSRVPEADGVNNHEGSWFTSDHKALIPVMQVLAEKHLFFLDSRTTTQSKGVKLARAAGVPVAGRDVFIDDVLDSGAIARQLGQIEAIARRRGLAIAIGHPHHQTLAALEAWIPAVEKQGYVLIPVSEAIKLRNSSLSASAE